LNSRDVKKNQELDAVDFNYHTEIMTYKHSAAHTGVKHVGNESNYVSIGTLFEVSDYNESLRFDCFSSIRNDVFESASSRSDKV